MLEESSRAASFDELVRKGNSIRVCVLAMKAWLGLGRYGRTEKDLKVRTRVAIRVVQRVVGDYVTEEGSRVRVKFVDEFVLNSNIAALFLSLKGDQPLKLKLTPEYYKATTT
ncbi:hypothetical protein Tco_1236097 [Tanacetum coccineum]